VRRLKNLEDSVGIRVVNEAKWRVEGMWEWCEGVIEEIGAVGEGIAVYISDGWDLKKALEWVRKGGRRGNLVVVDTHRYYNFSERDRCQSLQEIIARFGSELGELDGKGGSVIDRGVAQVITWE
jgi:hypothetical protein